MVLKPNSSKERQTKITAKKVEFDRLNTAFHMKLMFIAQ